METVFELLKKLGLMVRPKRPIDSRLGSWEGQRAPFDQLGWEEAGRAGSAAKGFSCVNQMSSRSWYFNIA